MRTTPSTRRVLAQSTISSVVSAASSTSLQARPIASRRSIVSAHSPRQSSTSSSATSQRSASERHCCSSSSTDAEAALDAHPRLGVDQLGRPSPAPGAGRRSGRAAATTLGTGREHVRGHVPLPASRARCPSPPAVWSPPQSLPLLAWPSPPCFPDGPAAPVPWAGDDAGLPPACTFTTLWMPLASGKHPEISPTDGSWRSAGRFMTHERIPARGGSARAASACPSFA